MFCFCGQLSHMKEDTRGKDSKKKLHTKRGDKKRRKKRVKRGKKRNKEKKERRGSCEPQKEIFNCFLVVRKDPTAAAAQPRSTEYQSQTSNGPIDFLGNDEFHWKTYAQLLAKELHSERQAKTVKPKKKIEKPATPKQIASRKNFSNRVADAQKIRMESSNAKPWKECMAESYRRAKELNAESDALAKGVIA